MSDNDDPKIYININLLTEIAIICLACGRIGQCTTEQMAHAIAAEHAALAHPGCDLNVRDKR